MIFRGASDEMQVKARGERTDVKQSAASVRKVAQKQKEERKQTVTKGRTVKAAATGIGGEREAQGEEALRDKESKKQ